jgi:hypothetical protein
MKFKPEDMLLFELDYGDLFRPPFRILCGRGWGQCTSALAKNDPLVLG